MRFIWLICMAALAFEAGRTWAAQPPGGAAKTAPKKADDWEPVPGYKYREIEGFRVLINRKVMEENEQSDDRRKPLEVLELELGTIVRDLPPNAVALLRNIPIWVEWDTEREQRVDSDKGEKIKATAVYHPGNKLTQHYRFSSLEKAAKSNSVEILRMKSLTREHQGDKHRCVLLHEISHAVHHHLFDYENPHIKAAYEQAKAKNLYEDKYAITNEREYFAELSCAYFGYLGYAPRTREELKEYDPVGYRMMEKTWGTPEEIERAKKPELEKNAALKVATARKLLQDRQKRQQAIEALQSVVDDYPNTRAAAEAEKLLGKLKPQ